MIHSPVASFDQHDKRFEQRMKVKMPAENFRQASIA
jgi:hypothetical protein